MSHRSQAGRATGSLLLLLVLVSGLAAWNYHRNWQIERATERNRPYSGYAVEDLKALREAYTGELEGVRDRFEQAKRRRVRPKRDVGGFSDNVAQVQQTTRNSTAIRDAAAGVADRQSQISELDRELALREQFGVGMMRHVKRLTTI